MPWFAVAYIGLLVAIGLYSFHDDRKAKRSAVYLAADAFVTALWIYFVFAYFDSRFAQPIARLLPFSLLGAVAWTVADTARVMMRIIAERPASYDPELTARTNLWVDRAVETVGLLIGVLLLAPALIYAMLVIRQTW